ncbi:MAG: alcohol dehydrogenase catalytic domain-containing protein [Chloroflexi bacterium]|nr:alcohol dehydrogenase catalytic domain-containing protein [Chloroflexota bacterium]
MKAAIYYNNKDVRLEDCPDPDAGPGDIVVKIDSCGLCGGDTMEWYLVHKAPIILGHEPTGIVCEVGEGVTKFKPGDRVFVHHHLGCMSCHECRRGSYTLCENFRKSHIYPCAFAEYIRVPAENVQHDVHLLPDSMSFEEGTLIEPMACVVKALKIAGIQPGDTVAIVGCGFIGLGFIQLARVWGAGKVVAFDLNDWRLQQGAALGADATINSGKSDGLAALQDVNEGRGADVVIVTPNGIKPIEFGLKIAGKGATVLFFAPPHPDETLTLSPTLDLFWREIALKTTYSCNHIDTVQALRFIETGRIDAPAMITHRFGLHQVADGIALIEKAGESIKSVIKPALTPGIGEVV